MRYDPINAKMVFRISPLEENQQMAIVFGDKFASPVDYLLFKTPGGDILTPGV